MRQAAADINKHTHDDRRPAVLIPTPGRAAAARHSRRTGLWVSLPPPVAIISHVTLWPTLQAHSASRIVYGGYVLRGAAVWGWGCLAQTGSGKNSQPGVRTAVRQARPAASNVETRVETALTCVLCTLRTLCEQKGSGLAFEVFQAPRTTI